jgi:hypothetical protein
VQVDAVMKNHPPQSRTIVPSAALILVAVGLGGLLLQQLSGLLLALGWSSCDVQLFLGPYITAARQVASVAVACAMIVAGLALIWRDR